MQEGLLIKGYGGFYYVQSGNRTWELRARGKLRRVPGARRVPQEGARRRPGCPKGSSLGADQSPVTGDRVLFTPLEDGTGVLEAVLPRSNVLLRPRVANVDQVLLVVPLAQPEPDLKLTDRMLVCCQAEGLQPLICLNKVDLVGQPGAQQLLAMYGGAGYRVLTTSALRGTGLEALRQAVRGKTSVLAGPSGAGKTTIINALDPRLARSTGEISRKLKRGRHTTRFAELLLVAGGFIADTPGFSSLELPQLDRTELGRYFPEIDSRAGQCRFPDCLHHQEPECAVKEALDKGLIGASRYQNYLSFLDEVLLKERTYS